MPLYLHALLAGQPCRIALALGGWRGCRSAKLLDAVARLRGIGPVRELPQIGLIGCPCIGALRLRECGALLFLFQILAGNPAHDIAQILCMDGRQGDSGGKGRGKHRSDHRKALSRSSPKAGAPKL